MAKQGNVCGDVCSLHASGVESGSSAKQCEDRRLAMMKKLLTIYGAPAMNMVMVQKLVVDKL
jgi:hypothetical protein